jgi:hypothetical protein
MTKKRHGSTGAVLRSHAARQGQRLSGKGSAWSALGKLAATWPPTFPPKTLYAIRFYGAELELAATRHTRSDSGSQFGCRRPHIGTLDCNIRFANILWSLSCRPAKTGGPVGPSLSGQPLKTLSQIIGHFIITTMQCGGWNSTLSRFRV